MYDLSSEACPNPQCPLFGKRGQGNIVSNGTHPGRNGRRIRKLLCMALKLLVKGMPLRGVADVMEVKAKMVACPSPRYAQVVKERNERRRVVGVLPLMISRQRTSNGTT